MFLWVFAILTSSLLMFYVGDITVVNDYGARLSVTLAFDAVRSRDDIKKSCVLSSLCVSDDANVLKLLNVFRCASNIPSDRIRNVFDGQRPIMTLWHRVPDLYDFVYRGGPNNAFLEEIKRFGASWGNLVARTSVSESIFGVVRLDLGEGEVVNVALSYNDSPGKTTEARLANGNDLCIVKRALTRNQCFSPYDEDSPPADFDMEEVPLDAEMHILRAVIRGMSDVVFVRLPAMGVWQFLDGFHRLPHSWPFRDCSSNI